MQSGKRSFSEAHGRYEARASNAIAIQDGAGRLLGGDDLGPPRAISTIIYYRYYIIFV